MHENPITEALSQRKDGIFYSLCNSLTAQYPNHFLLETEDHDFRIAEFCHAGKCKFKVSEGFLSENSYSFDPEDGVQAHGYHARYDIQWNGASLQAIHISVRGNHCMEGRYFLIADDRKTAEGFFDAVCRWHAEAHDEVFVYRDAFWAKDAQLFQSIKVSTLDNLILSEGMKETILTDFQTFFAHRAEYEKHNIPWKRGVLFLGPPGNGKTHMVKALINTLGVTCFYVRSFTAEYQTSQSCIAEVFEKARKSTPCILVLEDLDSLVDDTNRSFFLNEMDGFYANTGILTLATTNHPERLDPAILERPSRFDRKYTFQLPGLEERVGYIAMVSDGLEEGLRLDAEEIRKVADATEGFSFAYLKELFLSSMMAWITNSGDKPMCEIILFQVAALLAQMTTEVSEEVIVAPRGPRNYAAFQAMMKKKGRF